MTKDDEKIELLHHLAGLSHSGYDPANVFKQMRNTTEQLLNCDSVLVMINDHENNVLTAANHFNNFSSSFNNLTIPYSDPLVIDILVNKKHKSRLAPENPLLPSSKSEVFVPIQSPQKMIGCLYLGRNKETAFSPLEIKWAEMAIGYFASVMERTEWEKERYHYQGSQQKSKSLTISFIESLQQPAVIVDIHKDKFYQINAAFTDLFEISQNDLSHLAFSAMCRDHLKIKDLDPEAKQNFITNWTFKDNQLKSLKTVFTFLDNVETGMLLLIFQEDKQNTQELNNFWLHELFASLSAFEFQDLQTDYRNTASIIFNQFNTDCLIIHRTLNKHVQTLASYENKDGAAIDATDSISKLVNPNYLLSIAEKKKPLYLSDISKTKEFEKLANSGIQSVTCIPLTINDQSLGMLTLCCKESGTWNSKDKIKLSSISQISTYFIFSPQLLTELNTTREYQNLMEKAIKQTFSDQPLETKVVNIAQNLIEQIPFDYFSLTLFDDTGNIEKAIDLALPDSIDAFETPLQQEKIKDSHLSRVHQELKNSSTKANIMQPFRLPFSLPAHTSVVMVSGERYLGNFALGRLQKTPFSRKETDLLKLLGTFFSSAVSLQNNNKNELWIKAKAIQEHLQPDLKKDISKQDLLKSICDTVSTVFEGTQCKGAFVHENMRILELFDWVSRQSLKHLSVAKIKKLLLELSKSRKPILIANLNTFKKVICVQEATDKDLSFFKPFVISPIFKNEKIHVLMLTSWNKPHVPDSISMQALEMYTNQTKAILQNFEALQSLQQKANALEDYAHMAAHELKSPLQTIKNYASILKEDLNEKIDPDAEQYLNRLLINLDNMENMISELLNMSSQQHTESEMIEFVPQPVIQKSLASLEKMIQESKAEIKIDKSLPKIYANKHGFEHIITNLVSNAIKYTKSTDTPQITIYGRKNGSKTEITVADLGMGIAEKDLDKVFEPFFKQNDTPGQKSTGLGLPLVKRIVEQHEGTIKIESQLNKGTRFIITFPNKK